MILQKNEGWGGICNQIQMSAEMSIFKLEVWGQDFIVVMEGSGIQLENLLAPVWMIRESE